MRKLLSACFILVLLLTIVPPVQAQSPSGPVYIVQPGDTLTVIAYRFGVDINDLIAVNQIADPGAIGAGTQLVIPGLEGVQGVLSTQVVPLGETLTSLSRRYRFPLGNLIRLNRITSPTEIYAGASVIIPQQEENAAQNGMLVMTGGQSPLEAAAQQGLSTWLLADENSLSSPWQMLPGETLYFNDPAAEAGAIPISPLIAGFEITPLPVKQGGTAVIRVSTRQAMELSGALNGLPLHFFESAPNQYVALQGLHPMAEPGLIPFAIRGQAADATGFSFEQSILMKPGYYPQDPPLFVDPTTLDPANTKPEDDQVRAVTTPANPEKLWDGIFKQPVDEPACIKSWYGNRRSYNNSEFTYFHTGVDYGVCANLNIYAPARGRVVFAGPLTVRGNATIIDHGWGIYSGIWHQTSIAVQVGEMVEVGQLIGEVGATGRVTGPHLHWEVWVNGVQVEPLDWLENVYP